MILGRAIHSAQHRSRYKCEDLDVRYALHYKLRRSSRICTLFAETIRYGPSLAELPHIPG